MLVNAHHHPHFAGGAADDDDAVAMVIGEQKPKESEGRRLIASVVD